MTVSIKEHRRRWLRLLVETYGSQRKVADLVEGLSPAYVSQILTGVRDMGDQLARRIEAAFKLGEHALDNPSQWHAYVEELEAQEHGDHHTTIGTDHTLNAYRDPAYRTIPLYAVEAGAGAGRNSYTEEPNGKLAFLRSWIDSRGLDATQLVAVEVSGDSMAPEYKDGDTVLVDTRKHDPVSGRVYVFRVDHDLRLKRLYKNLNGSITVRSDNQEDPRYQHDETITPGEYENIQVLGEVVWRGG